MIRRTLIAAAVGALFITAGAPLFAASTADINAAIADAKRPQTDKDRDVLRHPADVLAFTNVKAGDKIGELIPGFGYNTRLLAKIAGPSGHIYATNLPTIIERFKTAINPIAADSSYGNISVVEQPFEQLKFPEPLDMVFTSENYHDFQNMGMFHADTAAMDKAVFAALKPGGLYIVTDYVAAAGTGKTQTQLHRIDPAVIKQEALAAGFTLDAESTALMNPNDNLTTHSAQGSSQMMFRFRKPR